MRTDITVGKTQVNQKKKFNRRFRWLVRQLSENLRILISTFRFTKACRLREIGVRPIGHRVPPQITCYSLSTYNVQGLRAIRRSGGPLTQFSMLTYNSQCPLDGRRKVGMCGVCACLFIENMLLVYTANTTLS